MLHTTLHRLLGEAPGPLTDAMIDAAVTQCLEENEELDLKSQLPEQKAFRNSDVVKDISALANSGGGVIVFGVDEEDRVAISRTDAGEFDENYERTIQRTCMSAITPPVFGVRAHVVGRAPTRAVVLVVPASVDGPHLIYNNNLFGAPMRTNADTHWMKECEIESAYRSRFDAARRAQQELEDLYRELMDALDAGSRAVLVGVARPRIAPVVLTRRKDTDATRILSDATLLARWWMAGQDKYHPLEDIEIYSVRPGLRSWVALPSQSTENRRQGHAVLFDDGSVGLSWMVGGHRHGAREDHLSPWVVRTLAIEGFIAALLALVRTAAVARPSGDVDVLVGIEWEPAPENERSQRVSFVETGDIEKDARMPVGKRFRPVMSTVDPTTETDDKSFIESAIKMSTDCLNQVGVRNPSILDRVLPPRPRRY